MGMVRRKTKNGRVRLSRPRPAQHPFGLSAEAKYRTTGSPSTETPSAIDPTAQAIEAAISKAMVQVGRIGEPYLTIAEACKKFAISRTTFYELLPAAEAAGVAVRVPPPTGSVRIPVRRFEAWLAAALKDGKKPRKRGARAPKGKE